jgi:hypothetical protein
MAQIQFKGKSFVQNHHLLVKYHELIQKNKELALVSQEQYGGKGNTQFYARSARTSRSVRSAVFPTRI